jgi:hypothetical protein
MTFAELGSYFNGKYSCMKINFGVYEEMED